MVDRREIGSGLQNNHDLDQKRQSSVGHSAKSSLGVRVFTLTLLLYGKEKGEDGGGVRYNIYIICEWPELTP